MANILLEIEDAAGNLRSAGTGASHDDPDPRDQIYAPPTGQQRSTEFVDLRPTFVQLEAFDQGDIGSCTANAIVSALRYGHNAESWGKNWILSVLPGFDSFDPSRLYLYYLERIMDNFEGIIVPDELQKYLDKTTDHVSTTRNEQIPVANIDGWVRADNGAACRDGIKSLLRYGVCSETTWPYSVVHQQDQTYANFVASEKYYKMQAGAIAEGPKYIGTTFTYYRIKDFQDANLPTNYSLIEQIEQAVTERYPVVMCFRGQKTAQGFTDFPTATASGSPIPVDTVYTGWVEDFHAGGTWGHAVLIVGFDPKNQRFLILNSWGKTWPNAQSAGYFWLPYKMFDAANTSFKVGTESSHEDWRRVYDLWVIKCGVSPAK